MKDVVVIFGSERLGELYARRNAINPRKIVLATQPQKLKGVVGPVKVVKFPEEWWSPTTSACEGRVRDTKDALKVLGVSETEMITE